MRIGSAPKPRAWMALALMASLSFGELAAAPVAPEPTSRLSPIGLAKADALAMPAWQRRDKIMDCVKDYDGENYKFDMGACCKGLWQAALERDFNGDFRDLDRCIKARAAVEAPVREAQREI